MANKTNKEMNIKIGQMLQTAREDKRITQEEVAEKLVLTFYKLPQTVVDL